MARNSLKTNAYAKEIGLVETVRAVSEAIAALADTMNALGLRIALARNVSTCAGGAETCSVYYRRLALLVDSAAGQVDGIQKLINAIEATISNES